MMRLAHANVERLTYLTTWVGGDRSFWTHDPDRRLRPDVRAGLSAATGVPEGAIDALTLKRFEGTLFPALAPRATIRWLMPLGKGSGYRHGRAGLAFCPGCLSEDQHLRQEWRLSFVTCCPRHVTALLDSCPSCGSAYAPLSNDLGRGRAWLGERELPFAWCPECGHDLRRSPTGEVAPELSRFQATLLAALEDDAMEWPGAGEVPALEGFDVLHQLLAVLRLPEAQRGVVAASDLTGPARMPGRRNGSFEDWALADRRLLLVQLAWLLGEWPHRFLGLMRLQGVTRRPLVYNMSPIPPWYDVVAEQVSQRNGKRPRPVVTLAPHLSLPAMQARRDAADTELERRRWDILCRLAQTPDVVEVARHVGVSDQTVRALLRRYNDLGPGAMVRANRGRAEPGRRLLQPEQEAELQAWLAQGRVSNAELADWMEARCGRRPNATSLWTYRRGCGVHSREGRRVGGSSGSTKRLGNGGIPATACPTLEDVDSAGMLDGGQV
ncbi:hypothetical protein DGo_PC0010 (plasmid) [Deinococcus gobiensis I-0]|uniref:TniQ domain-containing protein n=2 Tax=Deinococcus TaxID=1298 RepID=H8H2Q5_DEIGI|nr:hypothetical protein DGo_PC0010 [Deinococcus gobiensis I-0]